MPTRTGNFPIGFRRGWSAWQKDSLSALAQWTKSNGFDAIDLGRVTKDDAKILSQAGLRLGSVDLIDFGKILHNDPGVRKDLIAQNIAYVKEAAGLGAKAMFTCVIPDDPTRPRSENYALAIECFAPIAQACAEAKVRLAVEGWPGRAPHYANLCCTPESCRAFIKELGSGAGLNYDPSHLIRLGVDPIRFLREFITHVRHVHAKDTELIPEAVYEYGLYQGSLFTKAHGYGEQAWRYTIPGSGQTRWSEVFKILKEANFDGTVSVELEDENFNGSEAGEKAGLLHSLAFLRGV